jgi:Uma2 family endonuclease
MWHPSVVTSRQYDELVPVPRSAVKLPLELATPPGFVADRPETWPLVEGQVELVGGRLYYLPPSADRQQDTTVDVLVVLGTWRRSRREFVVAGNEAGMILGSDARGADAAVWRRGDLGPYTGKFRRVPPVLVVEVQGELETDEQLHEKATWYLAHGVEVVWLVQPKTQVVTVLTSSGERRLSNGDRIPPHPSLPGLEPLISEFFEQLTT